MRLPSFTKWGLKKEALKFGVYLAIPICWWAFVVSPDKHIYGRKLMSSLLDHPRGKRDAEAGVGFEEAED
eukprot:CAMPEP_0177661266 /NCGR_PEP_ID=MMETSP0447-20121125/18572_1 /TAXON_ID=0 /ORGANISM="Stygamoeba regulata, Strain BSH-02190019" /LENGTH=69 /DNA_ID=CAMNT_0019166567 /DNA_START=42 /DNA_END=251 /DNA_ORIENTATION=+